MSTTEFGNNDGSHQEKRYSYITCSVAGDDVVPYKFGEKSSRALTSNGFKDMTFKSYNGLGHYTIPEEMEEVCAWLTSKLGLDGRST
ncbi:acyl-protein thioesterase 2-like [Gossypium australe]|uniref:Acyl-protein thioesterase 2-like n=1 Tax=Gossypium australe TaxID=47621 RepID=A0A5B6WXF2_9ROSI|nr:acyl-protein thioesterase 2-like [Gossypium australe]